MKLLITFVEYISTRFTKILNNSKQIKRSHDKHTRIIRT